MMKFITTSLMLCFALLTNHAIAEVSPRWAEFDQRLVDAYSNGSVTKEESDSYEQILQMGRGGYTENAIASLTNFSKEYRNSALSQLSREVMGVLLWQRKVANSPKMTPVTGVEKQYGCTREVRACPNGKVVGRTGAMCEFAKCP